MITLEVDGVRVEAETEKDARKALAKLLREQKARHAEMQANREVAKTKAEARGYRILRSSATGSSMPRWELCRIGEQWSAPVKCVHAGRFEVTLTGEDGDGVVEVWHRPLATARNAAGQDVVIFLEDSGDDNRAVLCWVIGVHAGEVCFADLPGVTMEQFTR